MWNSANANSTVTSSAYPTPGQWTSTQPQSSSHCDTPLPLPPPLANSGSDSPYPLPPPPPTSAPPTSTPAPMTSFQPVQSAPPPPPPPSVTTVGATPIPAAMPGHPDGVSGTAVPGMSPGGTSVASSSAAACREPVLCSPCGQFHDPGASHLYDYHEPVDLDLLCNICHQPLVEPLDTKCGHTFCTPCLKNHLAVQALCPQDKQIINYLECQQASKIVKRLLDKLLVVCPNVDYCEEILPRCELEEHLRLRCRGAVTQCPAASLGCTYQGPRTALASHRWECTFREELEAQGAAGDSGGEDNGTGCGIDQTPIEEGEATGIEILRGGECDLGLSFVGGCDTPLACIIIQEIYLDGVVAQDGRLRPGDQILEVNGEDLSLATHARAKHALSVLSNVCRLTIYREKSEDARPIEKEEILKISLTKRKEKMLGIKIAGKKNQPGLYILGLVKGGEAESDGRLQKDDRILEINSTDLSEATQDQAADVIQAAQEKVCFVVARRSRPQTPDIIRTASGENITDMAAGGSGSETSEGPGGQLIRKGSFSLCQERLVVVTKGLMESLGMSVAGGINSQRGDTPVYVTNVKPDGVVANTKQVSKGDILLVINDMDLLGLTHEQAVESLKIASQGRRHVTLRLLEGPDTSSGGGNFLPSWAFWLRLPAFCQMPRAIVLPRDPSGSLGFSIVGGNDCGGGAVVCPSLAGSGLPYPIVVKSIVAGSSAHLDGRLKCGDILVAVNNFALTNISHACAVTLLKRIRGEVVHLEVVSWPGTIV